MFPAPPGYESAGSSAFPGQVWHPPRRVHQWKPSRPGCSKPTPQAPYSASIIYAFIYALELAIGMRQQGCEYLTCRAKDAHWNLFEFAIVVLTITEVVFQFVMQHYSTRTARENLKISRACSIIRIVRFCRIGRIIRFVVSLRVPLYSIAGTLKELFWSMLLLLEIIYCLACAFTRVATDELLVMRLREENMSDRPAQLLIEYWRDIPSSMLTLFASLTNGTSWEVPAYSLRTAHFIYTFSSLIFSSSSLTSPCPM